MTRPGTVFIQLEEDECAPDRWKVVFRDPRNNEVIGVPVRGLPYEVALAHIESLGFAFEYGAEYATDVIRHEALLGWSVEPGAEPVAALDERIVSYILPGIGLPVQHVIESRERVALKEYHDSPWWRLKRKSRQARARPLSDWEYEDLIPSTAVTSEAAAVLWVAGELS
jgi:hypothetical protein